MAFGGEQGREADARGELGGPADVDFAGCTCLSELQRKRLEPQSRRRLPQAWANGARGRDMPPGRRVNRITDGLLIPDPRGHQLIRDFEAR